MNKNHRNRPHNCLFQVSLILLDKLLFASAWTDDKDAVIEVIDEVNQRGSRDLIAQVTEHDHRHGILNFSKNGHLLLVSDPFDLKPLDERLVEVIRCIEYGDRDLKATVTTRGSGGHQLTDVVHIGG